MTRDRHQDEAPGRRKFKLEDRISDPQDGGQGGGGGIGGNEVR